MNTQWGGPFVMKLEPDLGVKGPCFVCDNKNPLS